MIHLPQSKRHYISHKQLDQFHWKDLYDSVGRFGSMTIKKTKLFPSWKNPNELYVHKKCITKLWKLLNES